MTILITGIAGGIGFNAAVRLAEDGHNIVGVDRMAGADSLKQMRLQVLLNSGIAQVIDKDLGDWDRVAKLVGQHKPSAILHLAAMGAVTHTRSSARKFAEANLLAHTALLEEAKANGCKRFVFTSSFMSKIKESLYGVTKIFGENITEYYGRTQGMETVTVRLGAVYGPWMRKNHWLYTLLEAIVKGDDLKVLDFIRKSDTKASAGPLYMGDLTEVLRRFLTYDSKGWAPLYDIVATPCGSLTKSEVVYLLGRAAGRELSAYGDESVLVRASPVTGLDRGLIDAIGFAPNTPLLHGLADTVRWYKR